MRILTTLVGAVAIFTTAAFASPRTSPPNATTAPSGEMTASSTWRLAEGAHPFLQAVIDEQPRLKASEIWPHRVKLNDLENRLASIKGRTKKAKDERSKIEAEITDCKNRIAQIEQDNSLRIPATTPRDPGQFGTLNTIRVIQIIDPQMAVVEVMFYYRDGSINYDRCFNAWLVGVSTEGWTDDRKILLNCYAFSPGTHESGSRTLLELRPFSMASFVPAN